MSLQEEKTTLRNTKSLFGRLDVKTLKRYTELMSQTDESTKRATIYLEEGLHYALRVKAAQLQSSISELVKEAVRYS